VGVFAGSLAWWCGIVGVVTLFRHALGPRTRRWIDRAAGLVLAVFGLLQLRQGL
jgi:threonine/homoserine/homoserine lactone efflux protein